MTKPVRVAFLFIVSFQCYGCFNIRRSTISIVEIGSTSFTSRKHALQNDDYETEITFHARLKGKDTILHYHFKTSWSPAYYNIHAGDKYFMKYDTAKLQSYVLLPFQPVFDNPVQMDTTTAIVCNFFGTRGPPDITGVKFKFQTRDSAKWITTKVLTPGMRSFFTYSWISKLRTIYERDNPNKVSILFTHSKNKYATN